MKIECARRIPIIKYLEYLNIEPCIKLVDYYWYYSPFKSNKNIPLFKVDLNLNRWSDVFNGMVVEGDVIDFGVQYHCCSLSDFLDILEDLSLDLSIPDNEREISIILDKPAIAVLSVDQISDRELIQFLQAKNISLELAKKHLFQLEIMFHLTESKLPVLGLPNQSGGFQLRALNYKGAIFPDITFIDNDQPTLVVVSEMLDFLVALQQHPQIPKPTNWLVLNENKFNEELDDILMQHQDIYLLLGDDENASGIRKRVLKLGFGRGIKIQDLAPLEPNFNTPSERASNDTLNVAFRPVSKNSEMDHKPRRLRR